MRADVEWMSWLTHGEANSEISEIDLSIDRGMPTIAKRRRGGGAGPIGIDDALRRAARRRCVALRQRGEAALVIAHPPVDMHADRKIRGKGLRTGRARKKFRIRGPTEPKCASESPCNVCPRNSFRGDRLAPHHAPSFTGQEKRACLVTSTHVRACRGQGRGMIRTNRCRCATNAKAFARRPRSDNG